MLFCVRGNWKLEIGNWNSNSTSPSHHHIHLNLFSFGLFCSILVVLTLLVAYTLPIIRYIIGECDLVLIHAPNFHDETGATCTLDIHVRTKIRYEYSFIASAVLRIGDDTLEVASYGGYAVNGIYNADIVTNIDNDVDNVNKKGAPLELAGFPIYYSHPNPKQHIFTVAIGPHENITLSSFKDLVSVKIDGGNHANFGESVGIMGSFSGEMLARDGTVMRAAVDMADQGISHTNAFGQEWQVREGEDPMLFTTRRAPQYPQKCILPTTTAATSYEKRRRLGETIARTVAENACSYLRTEEQKQACIFDGESSNVMHVPKRLC